MKSFIIYICTFFSMISVFSQNDYDVTFYIHDLPDDTLYVVSYCGNTSQVTDSAFRSKDKGFRFTLRDYPKGMYMAKTQRGDLFTFLLDNSKSFTVEIYSDGEFYVENSPENDRYLMYQKANQQCQRDIEQYKLLVQANPDKFDSLRNVYMPKLDSFETFQKQFFAAYPDNLISSVHNGLQLTVPSQYMDNGKVKPEYAMQYAYYVRLHYWDFFHFRDGRILYSPYFMQQFNNYISEATMQVPDSVCVAIDDFISAADKNGGKEYADYIIAMYLDEMYLLPFSFNEIIFSHMVNKYLNRASAYLPPSLIESYERKANDIKPFLPGNVIPNLNLADFNGKRHKLYSLKNTYTVLYVFSATCENCKKNLDELKNFYKDYKAEYDVEVYSIDIEPDIAIARGRQLQYPFDWIVVHATADEMNSYNFRLDHTPDIYILDKDKKIVNHTGVYDHVRKTIEIDRANKR